MWHRFQAFFSRGIAFLGSRPATSFFVLLVLLFGIIALGNFLRTPEKKADDAHAVIKKTALFEVGTDTAFVAVPAKVRKENVVHITALSRGIVSNILTTPGRSVASGQVLLTLTGDYQSGSTELARKLTTESAELTAELAKIDKRISQLEEKKIKRDDTLSDTEESLELERLKKDRATRKSTLEQSQLSVALSNRSDAVLKPKTFTAGTVESIRVKRGDLVAAGDVLVTLSVPKGATTLETFLDKRTAALLDTTKEAHVTLEHQTLSLRPTYFSKSENEQGLFSVLFSLSPDTQNTIANGEYIKVALPLKSAESLLVPIDAIFQDDTHVTVLTERDGQAISTTVTLGALHGSFALIQSGLNPGDRVILNRSVIAGDRVTATE